jgi:Effector-associated domain 11
MDKKAQIQELISLDKTEEALEQLEQLSTDAVLLQSRFNGAKRQYSMGLIDFSEWSRVQAQINYAALEMMNSVRN